MSFQYVIVGLQYDNGRDMRYSIMGDMTTYVHKGRPENAAQSSNTSNTLSLKISISRNNHYLIFQYNFLTPLLVFHLQDLVLLAILAILDDRKH